MKRYFGRLLSAVAAVVMAATLLGGSGPAVSAGPAGDSAGGPSGLPARLPAYPAPWDAPHVPGQLLVSVPPGGEAIAPKLSTVPRAVP